MIEVTVKETEPMTAAFLAMRGPYDQIPQAMGRLYGFATDSGLTPSGMPRAVYFTPPESGPEESVWELWVPIADDAPDSGTDDAVPGVKHVPSTFVASTMYKGPYEDVASTYTELWEWVAREGFEVAGPPMEIYYSDPDEVPPEEYLTEIQLPVARR